MKYIKYFRYIIRHKWFVLVACWRQGLYLDGIFHDWSKFLPDELIPYANYFYGDTSNEAAFDFAWLLHQKRNRHHWQWWILPEDDGGTKFLPMSRRAVLHMLCDWWGAGKALGSTGPREWFEANGDKMQLHPETRTLIKAHLARFDQAQTRCHIF